MGRDEHDQVPQEHMGQIAEPDDGEITGQCFRFLKSVPILSGLDESALWRMATCGQSMKFQPGTVIVDEGDPSDYFHIVSSGTAMVLKRDRYGFEHEVARLVQGSYFGELGLLTNGPRTATVQVDEHCDLETWSFNAQDFHNLVAEHVLLFRVERERRRMKRRQITRRIDLKKLRVLEGLSRGERMRIERDARIDVWDSGEAVFRQGDTADRFYVVIDGTVDIEVDGSSVAQLGAGDFFGETALLINSCRTATVRSKRIATSTWSISRQSFQHLVGHYLLRDKELRAIVVARMPRIEE